MKRNIIRQKQLAIKRNIIREKQLAIKRNITREKKIYKEKYNHEKTNGKLKRNIDSMILKKKRAEMNSNTNKCNWNI